MPGSRRSTSARQLPGAAPASWSAAAHSAATLSQYSRSRGSCGTRPTRRTSSLGRARCGVSPPTRTPPAAGVCSPTRLPSRVDLPAPLRPISAVISPGRRTRSTPRSARTGPRSTASRSTTATGSPHGAGAVAGRSPSRRVRSGAARRRASRTDSGSGVQPASRPRPTTGGWTGERAITSAGSPSTGARPAPGSSSTRSAYCTTRSRRCSAIRTVVPRSWTSRWRTASTSSAAPGSSAEVGSSRTRTRGWTVSTEPIATRCCCPPESVPRARARRSARPSRSRVSSTRRRITSGASPSDSMPYASSSSTVSVTKCASGSWPTVPTRSASSRGRWARVSRPPTVTRPCSTPPVKCGTRPLTVPSRVDLPEPDGPTSRQSSPSGTVRSTPLNAGEGASW